MGTLCPCEVQRSKEKEEGEEGLSRKNENGEEEARERERKKERKIERERECEEDNRDLHESIHGHHFVHLVVDVPVLGANAVQVAHKVGKALQDVRALFQELRRAAE